jgi:tetratricopeptide (TPR) repeat protein
VLRKALYFSPGEEKPKKGLTPLEMDLLQQKVKPVAIPAEPDIHEDSEVNGKTLQDDQAKQLIQTDTLAEIYIKQGHLEKALSIYQEILAREPGNMYVQEKYETLQKQLEAQRKAASYQRTMHELERWLTAVAPQEEPHSP